MLIDVSWVDKDPKRSDFVNENDAAEDEYVEDIEDGRAGSR